MAYKQIDFFIYYFLFKLISQINCHWIYAAWVEILGTTVYHRLQIGLDDALEHLLAIHPDGYRLAEVNQLIVKIYSQLATCGYGIAAVELQVDAPLLILHGRGVIHITYLDGNHILVDIHLVVSSLL